MHPAQRFRAKMPGKNKKISQQGLSRRKPGAEHTLVSSMGDVVPLLRDCERFVLEFFSVVSTSCLQVYHSALLFSPSDTLIMKTYGQELDIPIKVLNASDNTWNLCIRTMDGHTNSVASVTFSPDGTRVVSGSYDNTLRLWDAVSGAHLNTLKGHTSYVNSVAFSPDGTRVVSGSDDQTLRLWDAVSGAHLDTIEGGWIHATSIARSISSSQTSFSSGPAVASSTPGYIIKDGWLYSVTRKRRVCWIPVSCRPRCVDASGNRVALCTGVGRVVILDFSGC